MLNEVEFEGYITRSWVDGEDRFLRLANHPPGENGKTFSDYVTVQIDPALDLDARRVKIGQLIQIAGRIAGKRSQSGRTTIFFTLILTGLLLLTAVGIEIGRIVYSRGRGRKSA